MGDRPRRFDTLLLDLDGVVINDRQEMPGASVALKMFLERGLELIFVTNNVSIERAELTTLLQSLIPGHRVRIVDPLDVFEAFFHPKHAETRKSCFVLGTKSVASRLNLLGYELLDSAAGESASIVVVSSVADMNFQQVTCACRAVLNVATLYGTGREKTYLWRNKVWPGTGAILAAIEAATTSKAIILGKPSPEIFRLAITQLADPTRILFVGDDINIDIIGARAAGLHSVLVNAAFRSSDLNRRSQERPDHVVSDLLSLASDPILM